MPNSRIDFAPKHVAIIMDGNGKWANQRLLPKIMGHRKGAETAKAISLACKNHGVEYLTLYVFSSENWNRPENEINGVMDILREYLQNNIQNLTNEGIALKFIGDLSRIPADLREMTEHIAKATEDNSFNLIFALSYGSRDEIKNAALNFTKDVVSGNVTLDEANFEDYLYTKSIPNPDLLIRTGGEYRISNFLLYQLSYTELYFTDILWPDFSEEDLQKAFNEFCKRERRYGGRLDEAV